jgi:tetratricopeptide (TPR) repeat protein
MGRSLHLNNRKEGDREASEVMVDARYLAADLIRQLNDRKRESVAEAHVEEGLANAQRLRQLEPKRASAVGRVATLYLARGDFRRWLGDSLRALADYKESRSLRSVLHDSDPSDLTLKFAFGLMLVKVGEEITAQREPRQAKKAIEELKLAERLFTELRGEKLDDGRFRYWLWTAIQGLGYAYRLAGDLRDEMECHHRKLIIARDQSIDGPSARYVLAESLRDYGNALVVRDNPKGGIDKLEEAKQLLAPAIAHPKPEWRVLRMQASIYEGLAVAARAGGHFSDARDLAEAAYKLRERDRTIAARLDPHGQADLAENRRLAGTVQLANAQCTDARKLYGQAVEILDRLVSEHERPNPEWRERYAVARQGLAEIHWKDGGPDCNDGPVDRKVGEMIVMARQLVR